MFEGTYSPPVYNNLYNFLDGAQDDIFNDSYVSIPEPGIAAALPALAALSALGGVPANGGAPAAPAGNTTIFITAASSLTPSSGATIASSTPSSSIAISAPGASTSATPASATAAGTTTTASTSPTPTASSATAAVVTAPFGADSGYAYKRDMSNAHVLANRAASAKFRLNQESRRRLRRRAAAVRRRSWFW